MNTMAGFTSSQSAVANSNTEVAVALVPAGFWIRVGATMLDGLIAGIVQLPIMIPVGILEATVLGKDAIVARMLINFSIGMVFAACYYGYFYSTRGATPGKMFCKLKVLDAETGEFISPGRAILRETVGKWVMAVTFGIGYIILGVREDKRGIHDFIANTRVYREAR